jgi:hypothetical protein
MIDLGIIKLILTMFWNSIAKVLSIIKNEFKFILDSLLVDHKDNDKSALILMTLF